MEDEFSKIKIISQNKCFLFEIKGLEYFINIIFINNLKMEKKQ